MPLIPLLLIGLMQFRGRLTQVYCVKQGNGERAQWLIIFIVFPGDTSLAYSTHIWQLTASATPTLGDPILSTGPCRYVHACVNTHRHLSKTINLFVSQGSK